MDGDPFLPVRRAGLGEARFDACLIENVDLAE